VISQDLKTNEAQEAYNPEGLIPKVIKAIKSKFPELGIISDIALDPYTSHGQDGLIDKNNKIISESKIDIDDSIIKE
jgi:porphobilinogen synthase